MAEELYPTVLVSGSGSIVVAAIGDSLTYGYGLTDRATESYPAILADLLGPHYQVRNYGLSGRSLQSTSDVPYFLEENAQCSLEEEADIVLCMIGSNDTRPAYWQPERFELEYRQMLRRYQAQSSSPDIYAIVPPFVPRPRFGLQNEVVRDILQELIPQIASEEGVFTINLYTVTEGRLEYYSDGLHLNQAGNRVIAEEIYRQIRGVSAEKPS